MRGLFAGLTLALILGVWIGYKYGKFRTRLRRRIADIRTLRDNLKGLVRGLPGEWGRALLLRLLIGALIFAGVCLVIIGRKTS